MPVPRFKNYASPQNIRHMCRCSDSGYGKTIYLKTKSDPRMFTPILRHSQAFKDKFKTRTSAERTNKRIFEDTSIEEYGARSTMQRTAWANFSAVNMPTYA